MGEAFNLIRHHARIHNLQLTGVAEQIVAGTITFDTLNMAQTRQSRRTH
jgi:hypothetical protein